MGSSSESTTPSLELTPVPASISGGARFGRYRLCCELASGGMGSVYLARAEGPAGFEKLVALKRIHEHLAKDPRFVAMFLDEARIAARLHHPNVCSVIDFGAADGGYYLTMPYIVGESLQRVVRAVSASNDPDLATRFRYVAARIVADACEGLHAAHELRGDDGQLLDVVHRDVSPQNLLVGYDGGARVLDFGVASARHRLYSTATGEVKGKFAYIAPEQLEGLAVDRRADVWSLGVVLYECVALRRLFGKKTMAETVKAVVSTPVPALSDVVPEVPLALEEIVFKALARDPERRYESARQMGRDLLAFLTEERRAVGPAEVGELLESLFPDGQSAQLRLIERARTGERIDELLAAQATEVEVSAEVAVEVSTEPEGAPAGETIASPQRSSTEPRKLWPIAAAVVVALGVGAGAMAWVLREAPPPEIAEPEIAEPEIAVEPLAVEPRAQAVAEPAPVARPVLEPVAQPPVEPVAPVEAVEQPREDAPEEANDRDRARGRGTVTIVTPGGWALIYRGRARLGEAPGTFRLPAGTHTLGIQPFGRGDILRRRVRVTPNETRRLSIPVR